MPLVRVDIIKGKTLEYKKTVLDCIHAGLMESIDIEDWDRFQRIVEMMLHIIPGLVGIYDPS